MLGAFLRQMLFAPFAIRDGLALSYVARVVTRLKGYLYAQTIFLVPNIFGG